MSVGSQLYVVKTSDSYAHFNYSVHVSDDVLRA